MAPESFQLRGSQRATLPSSPEDTHMPHRSCRMLHTRPSWGVGTLKTRPALDTASFSSFLWALKKFGNAISVVCCDREVKRAMPRRPHWPHITKEEHDRWATKAPASRVNVWEKRSPAAASATRMHESKHAQAYRSPVSARRMKLEIKGRCLSWGIEHADRRCLQLNAWFNLPVADFLSRMSSPLRYHPPSPSGARETSSAPMAAISPTSPPSLPASALGMMA